MTLQATYRRDLEGAALAMGSEKKSEPPPREMWPSLPRATGALGLGCSSSTAALKAKRLRPDAAVGRLLVSQ